MSNIDTVGQIVATIRAAMSTPVGATKPSAHKTMRLRHRKTKSEDDNDRQRLEGLISQRVQALDPDDSQRGRKAFRIFLESVLLMEFGDGLINDPGFYQLVDEVQAVMERDAELSTAIGTAVASLIGTSPST